jgi:hypothetical protein
MDEKTPRRLGVTAPREPPNSHPTEVIAQFTESSTGVAAVEQQSDQATEYAHDPEEWMLATGVTVVGLKPGLVRRCQQGRFDSWYDGRVEQCRYPAARGSEKCSDHGGVAVAKKLLQENAVLMMSELVRIALDPDEKTADKLAALNSGLDRTGGLGRTVTQPETEVRSALMARLEAAYDQVVQQSAAGPVAGGVVAVQSGQEPASLARGAIAHEAADGVEHAFEGPQIIVDPTNEDLA